MVVVNLDDFEPLQTIPEESATKTSTDKKKTLFDMDDASYPSTTMEPTDSADNFEMSRVDLDESVVGSTSSSDDVMEREQELQQHDGQPSKKQQEQQLHSSHSKRMICIVVTFFFLLLAFAAFMKFGWQTFQESSTSSTKSENENSCQLCPDGFGLSTPSNTFDSPTSASSVKGKTCAQIWQNAETGEYHTSLLCALVRSEASSVCECGEKLQNIDHGDNEPPSSPVSAHPTSSPTMGPLYVPPNPVPENRPRSYFNYDLADNRFGPNNWKNIDMSGTYFREFGENGFGTWDGHLEFHVADSTLNRCSHTGKQSPVNLIRTTWGDSKCTASHQIRTRSGSLSLADERIKKQILPNKLRILLNRRYCLDWDNRNCLPRPPIADFPNYSSTNTHHSDLMHLDIKVPGEHQINGETFDAEIQMMHIHLEDSRIAYIGVPVRATEDGYNEKYQALLDHFQLVYDFDKWLCAMKQRRNLRMFVGKGKDQSTYLDDPDIQRRLQQQGRIPFDPYSDFLESVFFYRYNGSSPDPPCFPVTWFYINKPMHIDFHQLRQTKELLFTNVDGNCKKTSVHNEEQSVVRPIQPLGVVHGTDEKRYIMSCMEGDFPPDE